MTSAFIPFPELKYNKEKLLNLYNSIQDSPLWKQYGPNPYNAISTHIVKVDEIISQFTPGLISNEVKFVKMIAGGGAECHTDTRNVGILIPVIVEQGQLTHIHKTEETNNDQPDHLNIDGDEKVKIYKTPILESFYLDQPYFLNTHAPHSITVKSTVDRVLLTVGFTEEYDNFELIKSMYKNGNILV